jgi:hypothetical protein
LEYFSPIAYPGLYDDPSLCDTLSTVGGVGELYQRRSVVVTLFRQSFHQEWGRAEPQRASSFMKRVNASQILGEAV